MSLDRETRVSIEEVIMDMQMACEKFLITMTAAKFKLLELSVERALALIKANADALKEDGKRDNYKFHMLVPLQTYYMQKSLTTQAAKKKTAK